MLLAVSATLGALALCLIVASAIYVRWAIRLDPKGKRK